MPSLFGPMTLGEIIAALEALPGKQRSICFDWCRMAPGELDSYRGFYDHLALGIKTDTRVAVDDLLGRVKAACGKCFEGYKGGTYWMGRHTPIWVANYGAVTGWGIAGIRDDDYRVVIETKRFDE